MTWLTPPTFIISASISILLVYQIDWDDYLINQFYIFNQNTLEVVDDVSV